jgi:hypothetical protein
MVAMHELQAGQAAPPREASPPSTLPSQPWSMLKAPPDITLHAHQRYAATLCAGFATPEHEEGVHDPFAYWAVADTRPGKRKASPYGVGGWKGCLAVCEIGGTFVSLNEGRGGCVCVCVYW